jgi:hypothetical protein
MVHSSLLRVESQYGPHWFLDKLGGFRLSRMSILDGCDRRVALEKHLTTMRKGASDQWCEVTRLSSQLSQARH